MDMNNYSVLLLLSSYNVKYVRKNTKSPSKSKSHWSSHNSKETNVNILAYSLFDSLCNANNWKLCLQSYTLFHLNNLMPYNININLWSQFSKVVKKMDLEIRMPGF